MQTRQQIKVMPEWLASAEAEQLVALSRTSLWRLAREGRVKTTRIGRSVRYSRRLLLRLMEENATGLDAHENREPPANDGAVNAVGWEATSGGGEEDARKEGKHHAPDGPAVHGDYAAEQLALLPAKELAELQSRPTSRPREGEIPTFKGDNDRKPHRVKNNATQPRLPGI